MAHLRVAVRWHEAKQRGLGETFLSAVENTVHRELASPEACPAVHRGARRHLMERQGDGVVVVALLQEGGRLRDALRHHLCGRPAVSRAAPAGLAPAQGWTDPRARRTRGPLRRLGVPLRNSRPRPRGGGVDVTVRISPAAMALSEGDGQVEPSL